LLIPVIELAICCPLLIRHDEVFISSRRFFTLSLRVMARRETGLSRGVPHASDTVDTVLAGAPGCAPQVAVCESQPNLVASIV
jgi:hypothetical protein